MITLRGSSDGRFSWRAWCAWQALEFVNFAKGGRPCWDRPYRALGCLDLSLFRSPDLAVGVVRDDGGTAFHLCLPYLLIPISRSGGS